MLDRAIELLRAELSIIPVKADGTKAPAIPTFDQFKTERRATEEEVRQWFAGDVEKGIGVLCGKMSGNLVVLDFETKAVFTSWAELAEDEIAEWGEFPIVDSPRGVHLYAKLPQPVKGTKLAMEFVEVEDKDGGGKLQKRETLIEFRGDGQYVVGAGTPGYCHKLGKGWALRGGNDITETPTISMTDWDTMCRIAKSFNEAPEAKDIITGMAKISKDDVRPGSDYCMRSGLTDWRALLERHGWECLREDKSGRQIWKRPGKEAPGGSATLGFCTTDLGLVLYVFSTNADPFVEDRAYNIFAARALLEFSAEFPDCARALQREGYGEPASDEIREDVGQHLERLKALSADGGLGMQDSIDAYCFASRKFKDLWERKRKELDDDVYRYEICILLFAYGKLGTPEESGIVKGLRLARLWREKYDEDPDKIYDVDYASKKVAWVMNRPDKTEANVLREFEREKAGDTKESRFRWLSGRLGFEMHRFVQVGPNSKEATFYFVTTGKRWIRIGSAEDLKDVNKCETAVQVDATEDGVGVPGFPGAFRVEVKVKIAWEGLLAVLFDNRAGKVIRDVEEADGRRATILAWGEEYAESKGAYAQTDEDQVKNAVRTHRPYMEDLHLCMQLEPFRQFVLTQRGQRFSDLAMRDLMKSAGMERFRKHVRVEGKQIARWYWRVPLSSLPSNCGNGTQPPGA